MGKKPASASRRLNFSTKSTASALASSYFLRVALTSASSYFKRVASASYNFVFGVPKNDKASWDISWFLFSFF